MIFGGEKKHSPNALCLGNNILFRRRFLYDFKIFGKITRIIQYTRESVPTATCVYTPFGVRSGSVRGSRGVRSGSVRDPFGVRSGSVQGPFRLRLRSERKKLISTCFEIFSQTPIYQKKKCDELPMRMRHVTRLIVASFAFRFGLFPI